MAGTVALAATIEDTPRARIVQALKPFNLSVKDETKTADGIVRALTSLHAIDAFSKSKNFLDFYGKLTQVVEEFSREGLTFEQYVTAAVRFPNLFCQAPETVRDKIRGLVAKFSNEGLTVESYLTAALKQPPLFIQSPDTVDANVRDLVKKFANEGLTVKKYLTAALKQPPLFGDPAETVANHIRYFFQLADDGVLRGIDTTDKPLHAAVLDKLLTNYPSLICLGPDNIAARHALCLITGKTLSLSSISMTPKMEITQALTACISVSGSLPNPTETPATTIDASSVDAKKLRGERMLVELAQHDALDPALNALVLSKVAPATAR